MLLGGELDPPFWMSLSVIVRAAVSFPPRSQVGSTPIGDQDRDHNILSHVALVVSQVGQCLIVGPVLTQDYSSSHNFS